jgi:DNA (cytosine-5)-methyltransferase 1
MNLATTAALWPTPMANDGCKPSAGNRRAADLTHSAGMWMTPTARDHKDGATSLANTPVNGLLGRQVLVTPMAGHDTSEPRRTLNPLFVEALMGWPTGWTGFASVATALAGSLEPAAFTRSIPLVAAHALRTLAAELLADG